MRRSIPPTPSRRRELPLQGFRAVFPGRAGGASRETSPIRAGGPRPPRRVGCSDTLHLCQFGSDTPLVRPQKACYCLHMTHGATQQESDFTKYSKAVLAGRLPLFSQLSDGQRQAGRTDCVVALAGDDYPGCVGLIVCVKGRAIVCMSHSAVYWQQCSMEPYYQLPLDHLFQMMDDFGEELRQASTNGTASVFELDTEQALNAFRIIHAGQSELAVFLPQSDARH
jgi:hypothetical protein